MEDHDAQAIRLSSQARYMECLHIVHETIVLVFSLSDESDVLARKLRAEVKKLFVCHSSREALTLLEKHNSDPDVPGIGLIIADWARDSVPLLEALHVRETAPETMHLPFILTILMTPEGDMHMAKQDNAVRSVAKIELLQSAPSKTVFDNIIEIVRQNTVIEDAKVLEEESRSLDKVDEESMGSSEFDDMTSIRTDDDWTNASSMLPPFVNEARNASAKATSEYEDDPQWKNSHDLKYKTDLDEYALQKMNFDLQQMGVGPKRNVNGMEGKSRVNKGEAMNERIKPRGRQGSVLIGYEKASLTHRSKEAESFIFKKVLDEKKLGPRKSVAGLNRTHTDQLWSTMRRSRNVDVQQTLHEDASTEDRLSITDHLAMIQLKQKSGKRNSVLPGMQNFIHKKSSKAGLAANRPQSQPINKEVAKKRLLAVAKKQASDGTLDKLRYIDFSGKKINAGERAHIDKGLKYMDQQIWKEAILCFTRVASISKQPNLSQVCVGNIHYILGEYFLAVEWYTKAIDYIQKQNSMIRSSQVEEEYTARYNRSLAYFKLGNDADGVEDLERIVKLMDNIDLRETLVVALRRMGQYAKSITHSLHLRRMRLDEEDRQRAIEEGKRMKERREEAALSNRSIRSEAEIRQSNLMAEVNKAVNSRFDFDDSKSIASESSTVELHSVSLVESTDNTDEARGKTFVEPELSGSEMSVESPVIPDELSLPPLLETNEVVSTTPSAIRRKRKKKKDNAIIMKVEQDCKIGFRDLKKTALNAAKSVDERSLEEFMYNLGVSGSLYQHLCVHLSPLVNSLLKPTTARTIEDLLEIVNQLRLIPFMRTIEDSDLVKLATCVDVISLGTKSPLLLQNTSPNYVCFIMEGQVSMKLVGKTVTTQNLPIGILDRGECFAHIDALFSGYNTAASEMRALFHINEGDDANEDENNIIAGRVMRPEAFATYTIQEPSQILLVPVDKFRFFLTEPARLELQQRITVIDACGAFKEWSWVERLRLARMATMRSIPQGRVMMNQGDANDRLYLVMKGIFKIMKRQNRTELLARQFADLSKQAEFHDSKYTFHHQLRKELSEHTKVPQELQSRMKGHTYITRPEVSRLEVGDEIKQVKRKLRKAEEENRQAHAEEYDQFTFGNSTDSNQIPQQTLEDIENNNCEITNLAFPMIFGEESVLSSSGGIALGTIIADTACEVLEIHRYQLQTFNVGTNLMERIETRAINYPADDVLIRRLEHKSVWKDYKSGILDKIPKGRWPSREDDTTPFLI